MAPQRETKAHYQSRAGIEPISRDTMVYAKEMILKVIDEKIASIHYDDERKALRFQRERVAKLFGMSKTEGT